MRSVETPQLGLLEDDYFMFNTVVDEIGDVSFATRGANQLETGYVQGYVRKLFDGSIQYDTTYSTGGTMQYNDSSKTSWGLAYVTQISGPTTTVNIKDILTPETTLMHISNNLTLVDLAFQSTGFTNKTLSTSFTQNIYYITDSFDTATVNAGTFAALTKVLLKTESVSLTQKGTCTITPAPSHVNQANLNTQVTPDPYILNNDLIVIPNVSVIYAIGFENLNMTISGSPTSGQATGDASGQGGTLFIDEV